MMNLSAKSNIGNKVNNTSLPRTKPLMPLYEVISNSIHAIAEAKKTGQLTDNGEIDVHIIRVGSQQSLEGLENVDQYSVKSFEVVDNGIGLNDENLNFFSESDTDHKIEIGGKGVGRFICLRAFTYLKIESCFKSENAHNIYREFEFRPTKNGFHGDKEEDPADTNIPLGTRVILNDYKKEYGKNVPKPIREIARAIVSHFQLYFIAGTAPKITVHNQNNNFIDLKSLFHQEFQREILEKEFEVSGFPLKLYLTKSFKAQSHKLFYCAHHRVVKPEGLASRIVDLGKFSVKYDADTSFYYQAFVTGQVLDEHVDQGRIGFSFPTEEDEEEAIELFEDGTEEITLPKIRRASIAAIEDLLAEYLDEMKEKKIEGYRPVVDNFLPQYKPLFHFRNEAIKTLQPNLPPEKLDIELYKLELDWKLEVKEEGRILLDEKKDVTTLEDYKKRYEKYLSDFNEIGKTDLARYVVHRKAIIELLDQLLKPSNIEKFSDEDLVHSLFFPIRTTSDEVPYDKQNLWILDERLNYHTYLASDKQMKAVEQIQVDSADRVDLIIFKNAFAFVEEQTDEPHKSITIVEFKKPQRNDYTDYSDDGNPFEQCESYIEQIISGKAKDRYGRFIDINKRIPFFVYIVCEVTPTLEKILIRREFEKTPDGQGWFMFKTKQYNAYFEVMPMKKVIFDAKNRNRVLFDRLGLST